MTRQNELADTVRRALERYFRDMDGSSRATSTTWC
jgi:DNA-binding protein Fis